MRTHKCSRTHDTLLTIQNEQTSLSSHPGNLYAMLIVATRLWVSYLPIDPKFTQFYCCLATLLTPLAHTAPPHVTMSGWRMCVPPSLLGLEST